MDKILAEIVGELRQEILASRAPGWPPEAPLTFLRGLPPQTVGTKFGTELIRRILDREGITSWKAGTRLYDLVLAPDRKSDGTRVEVKCSTELPVRRFQQVRDPRPDEAAGRWRYDCLVCVGVSPGDVSFWFIDGREVAELIDHGIIEVQHSDSETNWFFPNEDYAKCPFQQYLAHRNQLVAAIKGASPHWGSEK
jgi:hypothetical protein